MDAASGSAVAGRAGSVGHRTERAAGLALIAQWRASGQSVTQFCRHQGVPVHRLSYWKRQAERVARSEDAQAVSEFIALEIKDVTPSRPIQDASLEIAVGAIRVHLPLCCDRDSFVRILRWTAETLGV
jgi:hypothetical protein